MESAEECSTFHGSIGNYTTLATAPLTLIPEPKERPKILHGRMFTYEKDIDPQSDAKVLSVLESELKNIEGSYRKTTSEILQNLHERIARRIYIAHEHQKWKSELEALWTKIIGDETASRGQYAFIAVLKDPKKQTRALSLVLELEVLRHSLKRTTKELMLIAEAKAHQEALVFYKDTIKKCEAIGQLKDVGQKIDTLVTLFQEMKASAKQTSDKLEGQPNIVVQETLKLYKELYEFVVGFCTSVPQGVVLLPESTLLQRINNLRQAALSELEKQESKSRPIKPAAVMPPKDVEEFIRSSKGRSLDSTDDFRKGLLLGTWIYSKIKKEIITLQDTAKALAALEEAILARTKEAIQGAHSRSYAREYDRFNSLLSGILQHAEEVKESLINTEPSEKKHAGLHYIAKQLAQANEIRTHLRQFKKVTTGDFASYAVAIRHVTNYLLTKPPSVAAISHLYQAIASACALTLPPPESSSRVICTLSQSAIFDTIAITGNSLVALLPEELETPSKIYSNTLLSAQEANLITLPAASRRYLMKLLIKHEHFSAIPINPELDVVLHILTTSPIYKNRFFESVEEDRTKDLKHLLEIYQQQSDAGSHKESISLMAQICIELHTPSQEEIKIKRQRYYKIKQLLIELSHQKQVPISPQQTTRLDWIEQKAKQPLQDLEKILELPIKLQPVKKIRPEQDCIQKTYAQLLRSIFGTTATVTEQHLALDDAELGRLANEPHLHPLITRWALVRFIKAPENISQVEAQLLFQLFNDYLSDHEVRWFWQEEYGIATMEKALSNFTDAHKWTVENLHSIINRKRGHEHFELWKNLNRLYHAASPGNVITYVRKAMEYFDDARVDPTGTWEDLSSHASIARWFFLQLKTKTN